MVAGTFDIIHVGHIRFLKAAKRLAENSELIVVVARNSTVRKVKNREPIFDENERLEIVRELKPVDKAILGKENCSLLEIIEDVKPDIIALGYDQNVNEEDILSWAKQRNINVRVVRLPKFYSRIDSSTKARQVVIIRNRE